MLLVIRDNLSQIRLYHTWRFVVW